MSGSIIKLGSDSMALVNIIDLQSNEIIYANERCIDEFGEVVGSTCYEVLQKDKNAPCYNCPSKKDLLSYPVGTSFEWEHQNSINQKYYLFNEIIVLWDGNRKVKIQVGVDITQHKALEEELQEEKRSAVSSFETLLDATIEGIFLYDKDRKCKLANKVVADIFGYTKEEMVNVPALDFVAPESHELIKIHMQNKNQEPYEAILLRKDGTKFPGILRGHDLVLAGEKIRVSAVMDISESKKYEAKILKLAQYDLLTGLPNRALLKEHIHRAIQRSSRNFDYYALLFIDLDNFKTVNDTVGHNIGDMVLLEAARRLKKAIRSSDIVARLGGDEFVVLIDSEEMDKNLVIHQVNVIAQNILDELKVPYLIEENEFRITASIGIKLFNNDIMSMDELMKYADSAMYNAKEEGRNTFKFFNPKLQCVMEEKIILVDSLRQALEKSEMKLHYQPQVCSKAKISGVEALIRWKHSKKGFIPPSEFIPVAEESGLIIELGEWIVEEAVKQIKRWEADSQKCDWRVSINVSSKQFEDAKFISMIENILHKYGVKAEKIRLELTEGILIKNIDETLIKLHELKKMGLSLSIDDFGTGYSSLSYLKKLPIDELKIDQSFIRELIEDVNDEVITQTIITIGNQFGLEVIAEGVETKEQYEKLIDMGCHYFQGYLFSKPKEAELL